MRVKASFFVAVFGLLNLSGRLGDVCGTALVRLCTSMQRNRQLHSPTQVVQGRFRAVVGRANDCDSEQGVSR
jgi:hypothetical protein